MKKYLIASAVLLASTSIEAAQQTIDTVSTITSSRQDLRTLLNTRLSAAQANFTELYSQKADIAGITAGLRIEIAGAGTAASPYVLTPTRQIVVGTDVPTSFDVLWIDSTNVVAPVPKVYLAGQWRTIVSEGSGGGTGAVDSVNGQTGVVVLDADDISDSATTNKFFTTSERNDLAALKSTTTGLNTGDQNLSPYARYAYTQVWSALQEFDSINIPKFDTAAFNIQTSEPACTAGDAFIYPYSSVWRSCFNGTRSDFGSGTGGGGITVGYTATVPSYSNSTCTAGQYALSASYRYDCVAANTWTRTALTAWSSEAPVAPTLTSYTIGSAGTSATLLASASLSVGAGGSSGLAMTCQTAGAVASTYSSGLPGTSAVFTLNKAIGPGDTCTTTYTQPGNGLEATSDGTDVASTASVATTNNSAASSYCSAYSGDGVTLFCEDFETTSAHTWTNTGWGSQTYDTTTMPSRSLKLVYGTATAYTQVGAASRPDLSLGVTYNYEVKYRVACGNATNNFKLGLNYYGIWVVPTTCDANETRTGTFQPNNDSDMTQIESVTSMATGNTYYVDSIRIWSVQ